MSLNLAMIRQFFGNLKTRTNSQLANLCPKKVVEAYLEMCQEIMTSSVSRPGCQIILGTLMQRNVGSLAKLQHHFGQIIKTGLEQVRKTNFSAFQVEPENQYANVSDFVLTH